MTRTEINLGSDERLSDQINVDIWERRLGKAIHKTNEAIVRMRHRERDLAERYSDLSKFAAAKQAEQDFELSNLAGEYRFWQSEVVRLAAQIGAAYHLRAMRPEKPVTNSRDTTCAFCEQAIRFNDRRWYHSDTRLVSCANGTTQAEAR